MVQFLLRYFGFQSRTHILRLFKICCLIVGTPDSDPPSVTIDLNGSTLNQLMVQNDVLMVQSHVLCSGFNPQLFFTGSLLNAIQVAIANAGVFFVSGNVDRWKNFRLSDVAVFVDRYKSLFRSYLLDRRQSCEAYYLECNKANRSSRDSQVGSSTDTASSTSSVVSSKMVKRVSPKSVAKNVPASVSSSKSASKPCGSSKKDSGGKKVKKNSKGGNPDPTIYHIIGKLFKRLMY